VVDEDHDWLDDNCEFELAKGFAPRWSMSIQDDCPGGEPVWAAKYFPGQGRVRIAFMPAYYDDCPNTGTFFGAGAGHPGDSEFTMVEISFNAATQHWEMAQMFLTAHLGTIGDRSQWVAASDAEYSTAFWATP
jgi:hypothetical protein